jgi:hypothetical protein
MMRVLNLQGLMLYGVRFPVRRVTLDEIVVAMRQHEIAGSRSAVWRFFERQDHL